MSTQNYLIHILDINMFSIFNWSCFSWLSMSFICSSRRSISSFTISIISHVNSMFSDMCLSSSFKSEVLLVELIIVHYVFRFIGCVVEQDAFISFQFLVRYRSWKPQVLQCFWNHNSISGSSYKYGDFLGEVKTHSLRNDCVSLISIATTSLSFKSLSNK